MLSPLSFGGAATALAIVRWRSPNLATTRSAPRGAPEKQIWEKQMGKQQAPRGKEAIDITDLLAPVLTPAQEEALRLTTAHPVQFSETAILEAARAQTGLDDFGPEDFCERLGVWIAAIEEDSNASTVTRANLFQMMIRYAATRLRVEDMIKRHPEILDIKIDRPIIVAGLPRSGTTHLLGLLSADKRLRSLPWWEATAPGPLPINRSDSSVSFSALSQYWRCERHETKTVHGRADWVRASAGGFRNPGSRGLPQNGDHRSHVLSLEEEIRWHGRGRNPTVETA